MHTSFLEWIYLFVYGSHFVLQHEHATKSDFLHPKEWAVRVYIRPLIKERLDIEILKKQPIQLYSLGRLSPLLFQNQFSDINTSKMRERP